MNDLMNLGFIFTPVMAGILWGMLAGKVAAWKSLSGRQTLRLVIAPFVLLAPFVVGCWILLGSSLMRDVLIAMLPAIVLARQEAGRISHSETPGL